MIPQLLVFPWVLFVIAMLFGARPTGWLALNCVAVIPLSVVAMVGHELGHALVGRAVGLRVLRIDFGAGRRLYRTRIAGAVVNLNALPLFGLTYLGRGRSTPSRWQAWLSVAAGPLATAAMVAGSNAALGGPLIGFPPYFAEAAAGPALVAMFGTVNAVMLFGNLFPFRLQGLWPTDGLNLLTLPFKKDRQFREWGVSGAVLEAQEHIHAHELEQAEAILSAAIREVPDSWMVGNSLAILKMERNDYRGAREQLTQLLQHDAPDPAGLLLLRNNIAWACAMLRDDAFKEEADAHSAAAFAALKNMAPVIGTRGAVLLWLGRHAQALTLLEQAYLLTSEPSHRALVACNLARCFAEMNRLDDAQSWLQHAIDHDPKCQLLEAARGAVQQAAAAPPVIVPAS